MNIKEQAKRDYKEFLSIIESEDITIENIKRNFKVLDKGFFYFISYKSIEVSAIIKDEHLEFYRTVYIIGENYISTFEDEDRKYLILKY